MKIEKTVNGEAIYLHVFEGEDQSDLSQFINFEALEKNAIVLDFTQTELINSAFIAGLIAVHEECLKRNIKFIISGVNETTKQIFDCVGLPKIIKM
jgi:anti-anti-sigma factor